MRPVFITGSGRNGTTMLGSMLGSHPDYVAVPECQFKIPLIKKIDWAKNSLDQINHAFQLLENEFTYKIWVLDVSKEQFLQTGLSFTCRNLIEWFVLQYNIQNRHRSNPKVWIDHDPQSILQADTILEHFPEAKFIHLVRDGRAVATSVMPLDWGPNTVEHSAYFWKNSVTHGLNMENKHGSEKIIRVMYEDILKNPEKILREICDKLGLEYVDLMVEGRGFSVLDYTKHQHALVGQPPVLNKINEWEKKLTKRQIEIFENIAGDVLKDLGYSLKCNGLARPSGRLYKFFSSRYEAWKNKVNYKKIKKRELTGIEAAKKSKSKVNR